MERREFLRASCSLCLVIGAGAVIGSLASCTPLPIYKTVIINNEIEVPLSLFDSAELQIVRPKNYDYDIALRKEKDGSYLALLLRCTHADNNLINTGSSFTCNLHGSEFDEHGNVTKGPAAKNLMHYKTSVSNSTIKIQLT